MLQRLEPKFDPCYPHNDPEMKNGGGIFINIDHISALIPVKGKTDNLEEQRVSWCKVLLNNGKEFLTPFSAIDIIEDILDVQNKITIPI